MPSDCRIVRLLGFALLCALFAACARDTPSDDAIVELGLLSLRQELASGALSAERVTRAFLRRIEALDRAGPALNAIIEVNPDALAIARDLDRRLAAGGTVGPLHGIPIVLKANIDTADRMATSAGSLALANHFAAADAVIVERLRAAGAVPIAKANMSEWANFRSTRSSSGWSSLGGQTRNPYVLDRSPCGSSSGSAVAVAARLAPLAVGTETDGSIVCPAAVNGVVGIKPTIGTVSQGGIVPLASSQDTAGPLARTVRDAALLLAVIRDSVATFDAASLGRADLRGIRIGVVRDYHGAGSSAPVESAYADALELLRAAGAELVDPIRLELGPEIETAELEVLLYEFKSGVNAYLATAPTAPRSLEALIRFNEEHAAEVMPHFGQELFVEAQSRGGLEDPDYRGALAASGRKMREVLEALFARHALDALVAPANGPAWPIDRTRGDRFAVGSSSIAAVSGYPSIAVPHALAADLPLGVAFIGRPEHEDLLLDIAAAFEERRGAFPEPKYLSAAGD